MLFQISRGIQKGVLKNTKYVVAGLKYDFFI